MTTTTATISEFILARLAEDEADQRSGLDKRYGSGEQWHRADCGLNALNVEPCDCDVPARVLAQVEAHRRIVEEHGAFPYGAIVVCGVCEHHNYPCSTLRALASVYAGHEDYRAEWTL